MSEGCIIRSDEGIDEFSGLSVIQKTDGPRFSLDAILLARFATVRKGDAVADLGAGGGIISLILATNTEVEQVTGFEIQSELVDVARRNIALNHLKDKVRIIEVDLRTVTKTQPSEQFDLLVCNPPYRRVGAGRINPNPLKAISRHELKCTLVDVLKASFHLLKNRGRAAFVYRPGRVVDLISGCRQNRLEPKRMQFVYPDLHREANLVLLEAVKNGQPEMKVLESLIVSGHEIPTSYDPYSNQV